MKRLLILISLVTISTQAVEGRSKRVRFAPGVLPRATMDSSLKSYIIHGSYGQALNMMREFLRDPNYQPSTFVAELLINHLDEKDRLQKGLDDNDKRLLFKVEMRMRRTLRSKEGFNEKDKLLLERLTERKRERRRSA